MMNNELYSANLTNNTKLTYVELGWNQISWVSLPSGVMITELSLSNNNLSCINTDYLPNLKILRLGENKTRHLSISENRKLFLLNVKSNPLNASTKQELKSKHAIYNFIFLKDL
ncbi:hypothetical protein JL49_13915 [Pseudoalteromonas luteoviolacea]|nr:hypothetical protein JL49_13915 [Pseudoalteromonas luteoviolacea]